MPWRSLAAARLGVNPSLVEVPKTLLAHVLLALNLSEWQDRQTAVCWNGLGRPQLCRVLPFSVVL